MSQIFKLSGKKLNLPDRPEQTWKFSVRPGGWVIAVSETGERKRFLLNESKGRISLSLDGYLWNGEVSSTRSSGSQSSQASDADLTAQFPGKVRKILVSSGTQVAEGDPLILVEAMKMEFTIKAPYAGKVSQVLVQDGQQLSPGDRLIDVEPIPHAKT